jgi:hypothetical protein
VKFPIDYTTQLPKAHCYVDFVGQVALDAALAKNGQILLENKLVINRPNQSDRSKSRRGGRSYRDSRIMTGDHQ